MTVRFIYHGDAAPSVASLIKAIHRDCQKQNADDAKFDTVTEERKAKEGKRGTVREMGKCKEREYEEMTEYGRVSEENMKQYIGSFTAIKVRREKNTKRRDKESGEKRE